MGALFKLDKNRSKLIYDTPLKEILIKSRPNRYVAMIELENGIIEKAHTPVGGRIGGLTIDGLPGLVSGPYENRTTKYTLEAIKVGKQWIGINQTAANSYVKEFLKAGFFSNLAPQIKDNADLVKPEKKLIDSRIDFFVESTNIHKELWIEVKTPLIKLHTDIPDSIPVKTDYKSDNVGLRMPKQMSSLFTELKKHKRVALVAVFLYENTLKNSDELRRKDNLNLEGLLDQGKKIGLESWQINFKIDHEGIELISYNQLL